MHLNRYSFIYDGVARYLFVHLNRYSFIFEFGRLNSYLEVILHLELMNQSSMKTNVELLIIK